MSVVPSTSDQITQATMWDALRIWWAWIWRSILGSMVIGIAIGMIGGIFAGILGIAKENAVVFIMPLGFLGGIFVGIWVLRYALNKKYGDFRIVIVRE